MSGMLTSSKLKTPCVVQRNVASGSIDRWQTVANAWCELTPMRGGEYWNAQQVSSEVTHKVRVRSGVHLASQMRLVISGRTFDLTHVIDDDSRRGEIEAYAVERKAVIPFLSTAKVHVSSSVDVTESASGYVTLWKDSLRGVSFAQDGIPNLPVLKTDGPQRKPLIQFNDNSALFANTAGESLIRNTETLTLLFCGVIVPPTDGNNNRIFFASHNDDSAAARLCWEVKTDGKVRLHVYPDDGSAAFDITTADAINAGSPTVIVARCEAGLTAEIRVDGVQQVTDSMADTAFIDSSCRTTLIGGYGAGSANIRAGHGEFVVWREWLSDEQVAEIERNLADVWGIAI